MQRKMIFVIFLSLLIMGTLFSYQQKIWPFNKTPEEENPAGTDIEERAPNFTLNLLDGSELELANLRGKKVFLNFWATWCPPCQAEMPDIQVLYQNYENIAVLGVNIQEDRGTVAEYMMLNGYSFPVVLDTTGEIAADYLVRGIPTTYILDERGVIMEKHTGPLNCQQMIEFMEINK